jgi:hypothetical protein
MSRANMSKSNTILFNKGYFLPLVIHWALELAGLQGGVIVTLQFCKVGMNS